MYASRSSKTLAALAVVFAILLTSNFAANAQRRTSGMNADGNLLGGSRGGGGGGYLGIYNWGITVNGGYELPLGDLKDEFKGTPTFGLTLSRNFNQFTFSIGGDYRSFQPKERVTSVESDFLGQPFVSSQTMSDFRAIGVYVGAAYNIPITPGANFYVGLNGGYIFSDFSVAIDNPFFTANFPFSTNIPYIGPKLGLNFAITNALSVGGELRYSTSIGKKNSEGQTVEGTDYTIPNLSYKSAAGNLTVTYAF